MSGEKKKANVVKDMLAGGLAGCLEVTIMYPTEFVKTQLQLQQKGQKLYNGMFDCAVSRPRVCPLYLAFPSACGESHTNILCSCIGGCPLMWAVAYAGENREATRAPWSVPWPYLPPDRHRPQGQHSVRHILVLL